MDIVQTIAGYSPVRGVNLGGYTGFIFKMFLCNFRRNKNVSKKAHNIYVCKQITMKL